MTPKSTLLSSVLHGLPQFSPGPGLISFPCLSTASPLPYFKVDEQARMAAWVWTLTPLPGHELHWLLRSYCSSLPTTTPRQIFVFIILILSSFMCFLSHFLPPNVLSPNHWRGWGIKQESCKLSLLCFYQMSATLLRGGSFLTINTSKTCRHLGRKTPQAVDIYLLVGRNEFSALFQLMAKSRW